MKLMCPDCGYDGENPDAQHGRGFRYLEDVVIWRQVRGFRELSDGTHQLEIDGFYQSGEGYDDGTNPRFECKNCLHEFAVPDGYTLEFV